MTQDFDAQLLESVAVRRRRMRAALLWGTLRNRRRAAENVMRFVVAIAVAAVLAAGCVGWAFLQHQLERQRQQQQQQQQRRGAPAPAAVVAQPAAAAPAAPGPTNRAE